MLTGEPTKQQNRIKQNQQVDCDLDPTKNPAPKLVWLWITLTSKRFQQDIIKINNLNYFIYLYNLFKTYLGVFWIPSLRPINTPHNWDFSRTWISNAVKGSNQCRAKSYFIWLINRLRLTEQLYCMKISACSTSPQIQLFYPQIGISSLCCSCCCLHWRYGGANL